MEINSSELGTLKYWENIYNTEIENYQDHGDVGEVWFGEETARRIVKWLSSNSLVSKNHSILDIGCGNGMLLVELSEAGFLNLHGIDYSPNAITLARTISKDKNITYSVGSILDDQEMSYDIALDKGTFDAVSLDPEDGKSKQVMYISSVRKLLKEGGIFIITSCNWTEAEILQLFCSYFEIIDNLPAPSFQFGGKIGRTVTTLAFKRR